MTSSVSPNAALVDRFYAAFARRDWRTMAACYTPDAHFTDEVFDLRGPAVGEMWRMLCTGGRDMRIEWRDVTADDMSGRAHWEATYTYSATGRTVTNRIDARFEFRDGLIARHVDRFDFWKWSSQALGLPGRLLGWSALLRGRVRTKAATKLATFVRSATVEKP